MQLFFLFIILFLVILHCMQKIENIVNQIKWRAAVSFHPLPRAMARVRFLLKKIDERFHAIARYMPNVIIEAYLSSISLLFYYPLQNVISLHPAINASNEGQ